MLRNLLAFFLLISAVNLILSISNRFRLGWVASLLARANELKPFSPKSEMQLQRRCRDEIGRVSFTRAIKRNFTAVRSFVCNWKFRQFSKCWIDEETEKKKKKKSQCTLQNLYSTFPIDFRLAGPVLCFFWRSSI